MFRTRSRAAEEIDEVLNRCAEAMDEDEGGTRYPGQSYEDGVRDAIDWLLDTGADVPEGWPFSAE